MRTIFAVDIANEAGLRPTTVSSNTAESKGSMKTADTVVRVVMATERAVSPPAMYVQRLLAWPPEIMPRRIRPSASDGERLKNEARRRAMEGMRM